MIRFSLVDPAHKGRVLRSPEMSFVEFVERYLETCSGTPPDTEKEDLEMLCPAVFSNDVRNAASLEELYMLAIDLDHDCPETFGELQYSYFLIESPSSVEGDRRYRIYLPLERPVTDPTHYTEKYLEVVEQLIPEYMDCVDKNCVDACRFMYVPNASKLETAYCELEKPFFNFPEPETPPTKVQDPPNSSKGKYETSAWNKRLCHEWALPTFNLVLEKHAPCSPSRPDSDSGNHMVHEYGIADFNDPKGTSTMKWSTLHAIFEKIAANNYHGRPIHPHFLKLWEDAGRPLLKSQFTVGLVEFGTKGRYSFVEQHSPGDIYIPLDPTPNEFEVVTEHIKNPDTATHLTRDDITYEDDEGKTKFLHKNVIKQRYRHVAKEKILLLGHKKRGLTIHRDTLEVYESMHCRRNMQPIYHAEVAEYLENTPIDPEWLIKYLYFFPDCSKSLPWIHLFGEAGAGKSFLALLLASIFDTGPVVDAFASRDFQGGLGENPVVFMDEQVPLTDSRGISCLNACKLMVTDFRSRVNKKYEVPIWVEGYHRLISAQNATDCSLPLHNQMDLGALVRRLQVEKAEDKHVEYLKRFDMRETAAWLSHKFAEHVAWIGEQYSFEPAGGLLALEPYQTPYLTRNTVDVSEKNRKLLEGILQIVLGNKVSAGAGGWEEDYFFIKLSESKFQEWLRTEKYIDSRISTKQLSLIMEKAFPGICRKWKTINGHRRRCHAIPVAEVQKLCLQLGVEFEYGGNLTKE